MVRSRSCAGPTGHPARHVAEICDALTAATLSVKPGACAGAGSGAVVVGAAFVWVSGPPASPTAAPARGPAVDTVGTEVARADAPWAVAPGREVCGELEQAPNRTEQRRAVTKMVHTRAGRDIGAHPSRRAAPGSKERRAGLTVAVALLATGASACGVSTRAAH